jgi:hypothetical protein
MDKQHNEYMMFDRKTGAWLGASTAYSSAEAVAEWLDAFGRTLGYGTEDVRCERGRVSV